MAGLSRTVQLKMHFITFQPSNTMTNQNPTTPLYQRVSAYSRIGLGSYPFAHHYLGNHFYFLFLTLLRCFNSRRYLQQPMYSAEDFPTSRDELSHSEIPGSECVCHSPRLIAACHVLRRQPMPRHPTYALNNLKN